MLPVRSEKPEEGGGLVDIKSNGRELGIIVLTQLG